MDNNLQDPTWHWLFVSSNGYVTTVKNKIGDPNMPGRVYDRMEIAWFVELRDWSSGISISVNGKPV
ncbi:hypothetical protein DPMN_149704 [Dreissena polymorpha]|uniref:Uncharacterized protein n=1 Tax=Dreissena polymorpha TaxID=45954 RepID=A0A9D4FD67_DREPO|nr:hypothetical protein DPMN_149704 [Dreissena polymorpha]